ncbi:monocarboxylate transporter 13-like [Ptychodera flava]|uniref:monocarboxylate transporter 13-like n=1 Tax=Ptychodera flava TaxID=63121 RepID=UPI00396A4FD4
MSVKTVLKICWKDHPDGPPEWWRYVIVFCNIFVTLFCIGLNYGMWILIEELQVFFNDYHAAGRDEVDTKWIVYINIFMVGITGPVASFSANKYGHRITAFAGAALSTFGLFVSGFTKSIGFLCFSYGILTGIGYGLILVPSLGLLPRYFPRRYTITNAICFIGIALSIFFFPPLFRGVHARYGRRSVFFILACLNAQLLVVTMLLRNKNQTGNPSASTPLNSNAVAPANNDDGNESRFSRLVKGLDFALIHDSPPFCMIAISMFFIGIGHNIVILHLVPHARAMDYSETQAQWFLTACGIFMIAGAITHGLLSIGLHFKARVTMYGFSMAGVALVALLSSLPESFAGHFALASLIGFLTGIYFPLIIVLIKHFIRDGWRLTAALGLALPLFGLGALIGLPVGDALNEGFDNYNSSYFFAGVALAISAFGVILTPYLRDRQRRMLHISDTAMEAEDEVDAAPPAAVYEVADQSQMYEAVDNSSTADPGENPSNGQAGSSEKPSSGDNNGALQEKSESEKVEDDTKF